MPESLRAALDYLRDLRANNNRPWFEQNRKRYDAARGAYETFINDLIVTFADFEDLGGVTPGECIYRIYRDVRFSRDKTPYKTNMGAVIGKGGRKSVGRSYYIQLAPDGESGIAGGLYAPSAPELDKMRRSIADDSEEFKQILDEPSFKRFFGGLEGEQLKTAPQGYRKDHPDIDLLRYKQYLAWHPLTDEQILSPDLTAHVVEVFKALKPLVSYITEALNA